MPTRELEHAARGLEDAGDRPLAEALLAQLAHQARDVGDIDRIHPSLAPARRKMVADRVAVDVLRRLSQLDDLLGEPPVRGLTELQPRVR
jgi:hypothetical protein